MLDYARIATIVGLKTGNTTGPMYTTPFEVSCSPMVVTTPPTFLPITRFYCPYHHGWSKDDDYGNCMCCGAPRGTR